jgi:dihydropteroate synthase
VFPARPLFSVLLAHGRVLPLGERPLVMGILNVTPDSFADAIHLDVGAAVDFGQQLESLGADILDIGGESTRPGAAPVSADDELARVIPVIRALAGRVRIPISVDTYKAEVAQAALAEGAAIVNDVSGLQYDAALAGVVAHERAAVVLTHNRGRSLSMYKDAEYRSVLSEVAAELGQSVDRAIAAGVSRDQVIVDPGIGFAKRPAHSYGVLARLAEVGAALGRPVLAGPSRKSFMRAALGDVPAADRDWGTAAAVTAAVLGGAHVVRVHAVAEMLQVVKVSEEIRRHG